MWVSGVRRGDRVGAGGRTALVSGGVVRGVVVQGAGHRVKVILVE
jgi:hypothetical protein